MRHLRALVNDERLRDSWSQPQNIALIQYALNERINSETNCSAFELTFGSADARYFRVSEARDPRRTASEWLQSLNASLEAIKEVTRQYQEELIKERTSAAASSASPPVQATYIEGDLVVYDSLYSPIKRRAVKLANRAQGPYRVISQYKNDVTCRHICTGVVSVLHVERLALFSGTEEQAVRLALEDADQDVIENIDGWRGDPAFRRSMEFFVKFRTNNDYVWLPWSEDFADSLPYEQYCQRYAPLRQLLMTTEDLNVYVHELNRQPITSVQPGDEVYVSLRYFDSGLFDNRCPYPNRYSIDYVVKIKFTQWDRDNHTKIEAVVPVLGDARYSFTPWFIEAWGSRRVLLPSMREVTIQDFVTYNELMDFVPVPARKSQRLKIAYFRRNFRIHRRT